MTVLGILLIIRGQWLWFDDVTRFWPGGYYAAAGLLLVFLFVRPKDAVQVDQRLIGERGGGSRVVIPRRFPLALVGIGLTVYAGWSAFAYDVIAWNVLVLWVGGIWLTMTGLVSTEAVAHWRQKVVKSLRTEGKTWLIVLALLVMGGAFRLSWLETVPYLEAGDEAQFAMESAMLKDSWNWRYNPFQMGIWHHPRTYHTITAVSLEVFGYTKTGARMPSAIFGTWGAGCLAPAWA
jgi:hypothetical protein